MNRQSHLRRLGAGRRAVLALVAAVAALPAVVDPADATHSGTLGSVSAGSTTPAQYDGKGEQVNVQDVTAGPNTGAGDSDGPGNNTYDACIKMAQLRFAVTYLGGYVKVLPAPAGFQANNNTFSNGTSTFTANPTLPGPIEGIVTVEDAGLYEGPEGTYPSTAFTTSGCLRSGRADVPVDKIRAEFRQGGTSICATDSTTGSIARGVSPSTGRAEFVLSDVKCGTQSGTPHSYTMRVLITQTLQQTSDFGVCVAPAAPNTCNILASQLG